jgi:hypothetical protein
VPDLGWPQHGPAIYKGSAPVAQWHTQMAKTVEKDNLVSNTDELYEAFRKNYILIQYKWVQFFVEHVSDVSRTFKGDLSKMLILATLGQAYLHSVMRLGEQGDPAAVTKEAHADLVGPSVNASRLSDLTGIPRQTVRRKLAELAELGWIEQVADGSWKLRVTGDDLPVRHDLDALDKRGMRRLAHLVTQLVAISRRE